MEPTSPRATPTLTRRHALAAISALLAGCGGGAGSGAGRGSGPSGGGGGKTYGALRVSGSDIVDRNGNAVMLRGLNWGRWGTAQPQDAADNAAQGANCVRIPLRWWGAYAGSIDSRDDAAAATGGIDPAHIAVLDDMMAWAASAGLWIVLFLDSNCGQDGLQDAAETAYCDPQGQYPGGNNFWTDAGARARFIAAWKYVADRYKDNPTLGLFEPLPEPDPVTASAADITAFYDEVMSAIRGVAPGVPFLLGARSYNMGSAGDAFDPAWTDVVYTGDFFIVPTGAQAADFQAMSQRLQPLLALRAGKRVPVFVQQVGVQSSQDPGNLYLAQALSLLTRNGVGFAWWEYRDTATPDQYGVLYQDGNGGWITKTDVLAALQTWFRAS